MNAEVLTPAAAARTVGLDARAFRKILDSGKIPSLKIAQTGRRVLYRSDLLAWLKSLDRERRLRRGSQE